MTIEVSTASAARALADYLRRCECTVVLDECALEVSPPDRSQTPSQARIEIEAYVRVWSALNPGVEVSLQSVGGD
jgi:hypothetical protein